MSSLRSTLDQLASSFAHDVLQAIRSASIEDLLAESTVGSRRGAARGATVALAAAAPGAPAASRGRRRGRLARRSAGDISGVIDRIVALVRQNPRGLRAEQIRQKLGFQSKELPRPLKEAVEAGRLGKSGQKRATTYFVKGAAAPGAAPPAGSPKGKAKGKPAAARAAKAPARAARKGGAARPTRTAARKK